MTIKAVIFDMDGVITNSEPIHEKTFDMVMAEYGVKTNKELKAEVVGMP